MPKKLFLDAILLKMEGRLEIEKPTPADAKDRFSERAIYAVFTL
ncbi:hypothetical protein [Marinomonas flavescens]|nr:hypothetical protein [Marinomonas flavescens]